MRGRGIRKHESRVRARLIALVVLTMGILISFSFTSFGPSAPGETVSITPLRVQLGDTGAASVIVNYLPNGISGYIITLSLSETGIASIQEVEFVAFDGAKEVEISPEGDSVTFSAIDLEDVVEPGATDIELARVEFQGIAEGESVIHIVVTRMDDDDGNVITARVNGGILKVMTIELPVADFSFSPSEPTDLDTVRFQDQSTDPDGKTVSWKWDFGDGETSTERNPSHKYVDDGVYRVSLTVTDDDGATDTVTKSVSVSNVAPKASFSFSPVTPTTLDTIQFTDHSIDPDGRIVAWEWHFGDGRTSTERNPFHKYSSKGTYTVSLRVIDNDQATNETLKTIKILNTPPTAKFNFSPSRPKVNENMTFNAVRSADLDGQITAYEWDWNNDGFFETRTLSPIATHSFNYCGRHTVTLRVIDNDGASNSTQHIISVNCPPTAKYTFSPANPKPGQSITFDASGSYDPDGSVTKYEWDWNNDGRFELSTSSPRTTHSFNQEGSYKVRLRVTDDNGAIATAIQRIPVKNPGKPPPTPPEDWENEKEVEEYFQQLMEYLFEQYPLIMWPLFIILMLISLLLSPSE